MKRNCWVRLGCPAAVSQLLYGAYEREVASGSAGIRMTVVDRRASQSRSKLRATLKRADISATRASLQTFRKEGQVYS